MSRQLRPPRRRHRPRRHTMAAGHVIVAMLVTFGVGTFANATPMLKTARDLPFDSTKRAVAMAIMRPIHAVADFVGLTWPRDRLDVALGHGPADTGDPFAIPTTTPTIGPGRNTTAPPPTRPGDTTTTSKSPPTTAPEPERTPTSKDPLRLFVAGDSLSFEYGKALIRAAEATGVIRSVTPAEAPVDYQISTGLARPDKFNWPAEIASKTQQLDPEVVVLMLGSNDDQSIQSPDGDVHHFGTEDWKTEYRRRVGAVMDQIIAGGRAVVYVGVPIIRDGGRNPNYQLINSIISDECTKRREALYVDSYKTFQDANGNYADYLPNDAGELVQMRTPDGVHFQRAGGDRLAQKTLAVIDTLFDLDPPERHAAAASTTTVARP